MSFNHNIQLKAFDEGNLRFSHVIKYLVAPAHALDHEEEAGRRHVHHPGWDEQEKVGFGFMIRGIRYYKGYLLVPSMYLKLTYRMFIDGRRI